MATVSNTTSRPGIDETFSQLKAQLAKLGLNLSIWDGSGRLIGDFKPNCELYRTICRSGVDCREAARLLAEKAISQKKREKILLPTGYCMVAIPLHRRRRVIGAAVMGYPSREMADEEFLARLCDKLELDRQVVAGQAERACRYGASDADNLADTVEWMLTREQSRRTANEELGNLSANLAATYEELSLLYQISGSMRVNQEPADFLHSVCEEILEVMQISAAVGVQHAREATGGQDTLVIAGEIDLTVEQLKDLLAGSVSSLFGVDNRAIVANEFASLECPDAARAVENFVAVPLVAEGKRIGVLIGLNKLDGDFDSVDQKLLGSIGNQASVFLANNRLYADLQELLMGVLNALTAAIDAKDPYTSGHSQRVSLISRRIAEEMGFESEKVEQINLCGLLHDIGKIGVPEAVLRKPGRLNEQEYAEIRRHPSVGARILGGIRQLDGVIPALLTHHERPDGNGYPQGLSGEEVPVEGFIIGLADSFDAMTSDRTYRDALPLESVIEEIRRHAGKQFDERVVDVFLSMDLQALLREIKQEAQTVFPVCAVEEDSRL